MPRRWGGQGTEPSLSIGAPPLPHGLPVLQSSVTVSVPKFKAQRDIEIKDQCVLKIQSCVNNWTPLIWRTCWNWTVIPLTSKISRDGQMAEGGSPWEHHDRYINFIKLLSSPIPDLDNLGGRLGAHKIPIACNGLTCVFLVRRTSTLLGPEQGQLPIH